MSHPIPQPRGVPVLGNILDIKPGNTWTSLKKLAEKYGEIFQIKVLGHKIVFVASVALAQEICDEKRFRKYVGGPVVEIRAAVHDALFTAYDNEDSWGIAHRIIAPSLQPDSLQLWFREMQDIADEMLVLWESNESNNLSPLSELNRLNLETTTQTLYGMRLDCLSGPEPPMIKAMEDSTAEAVMRPTRPSVLNWLLYGRKFKSAIQTMRDYAAEVVEHRKANPTNRKDLLAAMMNHTDPKTGSPLSESQVIDEVVSMPIGSSTAPCLLTMAIYLLSAHPDVIARARDEIDSVVGTGRFEYSHLSQLKYVEAIIRESLRLSYAAPGFNIEPIPSKDQSPILLANGKYQIAHNQPIIIVMAGVNRDPSVFEEPLAFKPERMLGEVFERLPEGAKKWFGNGKRECIGKHYAWQWSVLVLAMMLRSVDFKRADASYTLEQDGWFNYRPAGFRVRVRSRATK